MSLDGFITGPNEGVNNPLGDDDGRLHDWMFAKGTDADHAVLTELYERSGAVIMGRRMFDVGEEPWGDPPPFGMPVFIVTHRLEAPRLMQGGTTYTFVDGIHAALDQAQTIAGAKDIAIFGGAKVIQQYLVAGRVDELQLHVVPVLLGGGVRLFENLGRDRIEFELVRTIDTPNALHLRFRPRR